MIDIHDRAGGNVIAVEKCKPEEAHKLGIVSLKLAADGPLVDGLIEKPARGTAPTNLFISGRYVLQAEVFSLLETLPPGAGGEVQLTDALIALLAVQEIRPFEFRGRTFDCGSPAGYVGANLALAMRRPDLAAELGDQIAALAGERPERFAAA
ncbi:MAG: sugar phosphate nucleotidyltransferase, partial [Mesorhizobium sp.]|nr:sugar phosphate nucleotidyltransferase [Mesorhizobium sp.]